MQLDTAITSYPPPPSSPYRPSLPLINIASTHTHWLKLSGSFPPHLPYGWRMAFKGIHLLLQIFHIPLHRLQLVVDCARMGVQSSS